jgi:hypothetical protein
MSKKEEKKPCHQNVERNLFWGFDLGRYNVFCYTTANSTGTYYLKPILNGYKHPYLKWHLNPQTTVSNGRVLPLSFIYIITIYICWKDFVEANLFLSAFDSLLKIVAEIALGSFSKN